ncbi:MAG: histidine phosphatase family protein [Acidiphilium sp.]|nr:histidine phosphatase family protein [Acidiphilium sp.]MDD4934694.1 histidine phosphatase family protein [Acidiphilium sp.]
MSLPRVAFWFLRHGQTDENARGVSQGGRDIPLNATGVAQAHHAAPQLERRGITGIVASPMQRARVTAEIVGEALRLPVCFDPDLREGGFGGMEGKPLASWFDDWLKGVATPDGAESFSDLKTRAAQVMGRLLSPPGPILPGPILIVSHGAFFRALRGLMGLELDIRTPNAVPIQCEPVGQRWRATVLE